MFDKKNVFLVVYFSTIQTIKIIKQIYLLFKNPLVLNRRPEIDYFKLEQFYLSWMSTNHVSLNKRTLI